MGSNPTPDSNIFFSPQEKFIFNIFSKRGNLSYVSEQKKWIKVEAPSLCNVFKASTNIIVITMVFGIIIIIIVTITVIIDLK